MPQGHAVSMVIDAAFLLGLLKPVFVDIIRQVFSDQGHIGMRLQRNFKCQVTGHPAHDFADVPIFNIRAAIRAKIAD